MGLILFDTNIFIDMLNGIREATTELGSYDDPAISIITYMELLSGAVPRPRDRPILEALLDEFSVVQLDPQITRHAISIRGNSLRIPPKIKLPDAIIAATALSYRMPLITRNGRDFSRTKIAVHIPYEFDSRTGLVKNVKPPYTL